MNSLPSVRTYGFFLELSHRKFLIFLTKFRPDRVKKDSRIFEKNLVFPKFGKIGPKSPKIRVFRILMEILKYLCAKFHACTHIFDYIFDNQPGLLKNSTCLWVGPVYMMLCLSFSHSGI